MTGGSPSSIDGTLRSSIPGADFYLVNPAGVVFGPNASLDVQGSFAVSTADYVRLADGGRFAATANPADSVLTTAPPAAFGFLAANPAGVSVRGFREFDDDDGDLIHAPTLQPAHGRSLSAVAGGVRIVGGRLSATGGGRVGVLSVASAGEATLEPGTVLPVAFDDAVAGGGPFAALGPAEVAGGGRISGEGGVRVLAGDLTVAGDFAGISSESSGGDAGAVTVTAGGDLTVTGGFARISSRNESEGDGGAVTVTAGGGVTVADGARIFSKDGFGAFGGAVAVSAGGDLTVAGVASGDARISGGGVVAVSAGGDLTVADGSISSVTRFGAGAVTVTAGGGVTVADGAGISSVTRFGIGSSSPLGASGDVAVSAATAVAVLRGGRVESVGQAAAGRVDVRGRRVVLDGEGTPDTDIRVSGPPGAAAAA